MCPVQSCFACKSFSELSWDSCLVRRKLDILWYCGIVTALLFLVHTCFCWQELVVLWLLQLLEWSLTVAIGFCYVWLDPALAKLDGVSALVVSRTVESRLLRNLTICVLKPSLWTAWISFAHSS